MPRHRTRRKCRSWLGRCAFVRPPRPDPSQRRDDDRQVHARADLLAVFGATLLLVGILGFIAESAFDTGSDVNGSDFIIFEVNGWHNLVHIASGLLGLVLWRSAAGARSFALGFGAVYMIVTLWGFIDGNDVLGLIPVNGADNVLHLLIAAAGIAAGLMSREAPAGARHVNA